MKEIRTMLDETLKVQETHMDCARIHANEMMAVGRILIDEAERILNDKTSVFSLDYDWYINKLEEAKRDTQNANARYCEHLGFYNRLADLLAKEGE